MAELVKNKERKIFNGLLMPTIFMLSIFSVHIIKHKSRCGARVEILFLDSHKSHLIFSSDNLAFVLSTNGHVML